MGEGWVGSDVEVEVSGIVVEGTSRDVVWWE